ncbi:toxic anion resistance protein [Kordiimonas marina]|uniref:toxic anion resistance protein n=1 Tax=Kordiimonas marina TaxID=2872312 RepID=UPI001FF55890|nr:toxic anion resistance protein [Kordiimonas marina]MCJ9430070.1 toxic anion resistance protein [Kordiimonas marina]
MTDTQTKTMVKSESSLSLSLPPVAEMKGELVPYEQVPGKKTAPDVDPALAGAADRFVDMVLTTDLDGMARAKQRAEVDTMGLELQRQSANQNRLLQEPIRNLSQAGSDGGPVANALIDLKTQVDDLNPTHMDFSVSSLARAFSWLPLVGNKLERYFLRFETSQGILDQITTSLEEGKNKLERDNITLSHEQSRMRELSIQLAKQVQLGQLIDAKLEAAATSIAGTDAERSVFIQEELLFPLRQRIMDLQQQVAVNQQAVLAMEVIIRNNRELIRGVDRALNVTVSALSVAVTVALALNNQKLVLDRITALNTTTSNLISGTARQLRTQGVEIQKQASSAMLDMNALKSAFDDIEQALDEIARYRQEALPMMASQIVELNTMNAKASEAIAKMERGKGAADSVTNLDGQQ